MNYTTAVFLINKHVRGVLCTYEADEGAKRTLFKTLDDTIQIGDYVVVPTDTRHKMTVCKVVDVDVDVNFDSPEPVQWIIGKVDVSEYEKTLTQEDDAVRAIKAAELRKKREDLRDSLLAQHAEDIKRLPIAKMNGDGEQEPAQE